MIKLEGRIISINQNNSGTVSFTFCNTDRKKIDLNGYTTIFKVKHKKNEPDSAAIISKTYSDFPEQTYTVKVDLYEQDTAHPVDCYYWAVVLKKGSYVNEAASGPFYIIEGVIDDTGE